jgi:hypothetical protein
MTIKVKIENEINEINLPAIVVEKFKEHFKDRTEIEHDEFLKFVAIPEIYKKYAYYPISQEAKEFLIKYLDTLPLGENMCPNPEEAKPNFSDDVTFEDLRNITVGAFYKQTLEFIDNDPYFFTHDGFVLLLNYLRFKNGKMALELNNLISKSEPQFDLGKFQSQ